MTIYQIRALSIPSPQLYQTFNEEYRHSRYKHERYYHTGIKFNYGDLILDRQGRYMLVVDCAEEPSEFVKFAIHTLEIQLPKLIPHDVVETEYGFIASLPNEPEFPLAWWWLKSDWLIQWSPAETAAQEQREAFTAAFFDRVEL